MTIILFLLVVSLAIGAGGLALFLWSLRSGQYEDLDGAANRILFDEETIQPGSRRSITTTVGQVNSAPPDRETPVRAASAIQALRS